MAILLVEICITEKKFLKIILFRMTHTGAKVTAGRIKEKSPPRGRLLVPGGLVELEKEPEKSGTWILEGT